MKKLPEDIIIFHKCTINKKHTMYYDWNIRHDRQNTLSLLPCQPEKSKFWKNGKKTPRDIII